MKNFTNYYVGIDAGTNSVGFAVVDENYKVIKIGGKHLWGVRLFDEALKADARRTKRSQRRALQRKKERIKLLQELTFPLIKEMDENFFKKLKNSFLLNVKDDDEFGRVNIFNLFDDVYTDKDYYRKYPTIYHLRKDLIEKDKKFDIRLVYLAMHNLIKYRGNFLFEDEEVNNCGGSIELGLNSFIDNLNEHFEETIENYDKDYELSINVEEVKKTLLDKSLKRAEKKDKIKGYFNFKDKNKKVVDNIIQLILGYEADLSVIFKIDTAEEEAETKKKFKQSFNKETFDVEIQELDVNLGGKNVDSVMELKKVYDSCKFQSILGENHKFLYEGMIFKYDKYGVDLKKFRDLLKKSINESNFNEFSKEAFKKYIAVDHKFKGISVGVKRNITRTDDDIKTIKKIVALCVDCEEKEYVNNQIDAEDFLKPLNTVENSAIPHQIQLKELEIIIDNQSKYYPELVSIKDKIISLLTFRRPYYVGVLNTDSEHSWITQKIDQRVYPWNFNELVNLEEASENFIKNMTNKCVLLGKEVLPLCSILYQKYIVLNEINTLKIKNSPITVEQKQAIFNELFKKQKTVKVGDVAKLLKDRFDLYVSKEDIGEQVSNGLKFNSSMSSYIDMKNIFGEDFSEDNINLYDEIIEKLTVFNDKEMRTKALKKLGVQEDKIKKLIKLKYAKCGKYCKEALDGVTDNCGRTVIEVMMEENKHFNAVLSDETLGFKEKFYGNKETKDRLVYSEILNEQFVSPSVKRMVWQTIKVVKEITKIMGCKPKGIFIESTRSEEVKKQTSSRYQTLKYLYKNVENITADARELLNKGEEEANALLKNDFVYLYMLQMGRSMYSGKPLGDINDLSKNCEIDHIVPRCYVKDDSFSNRVLVLKEENQVKTSTLGIQPSIVENMLPFWEDLKRLKLLGEKKFKKLIKTEYDEKDFQGFVNKQLVETSQSVKYMTEIFKEYYKETDVQMINAGLSHEFRKCMTDKNDVNYFNFYKIRELNDFHHAKDAYLAVCLGMFTKYAYPVWGQTDEAKALKFKMKDEYNRQEFRELVNKRYGIIIDKLIGGGVFDENGEVKFSDVEYNNILRTMDLNDCLVSHKLEYVADYEFYKQTIYPKGVGKISQRFRRTRTQ